VGFDNLPEGDLSIMKVFAQQWGGKVRAIDEATDINMPPPQAVTQEQALEQILKGQPEPKPRYTGGHFEENDVVAHIRFNERVDPDGNKVLFIEEIQSDWAHKGQTEGFVTAESKAARTRMEDIVMRRNVIRDELQEIEAKSGYEYREKRRLLKEEYNSLTHEYNKIKNTGLTGAVTRGPFVTDTHQWTNLALKRMIRWGSDNGFDSIGWVTGKQSADRYNVSKVVDSIHWNPDSTRLVAVEKGGNNMVINELVPEDKLADFIGKEPANRLLESRTDKAKVQQQFDDGLLSESERDYMIGSHSLEGTDLDIGGDYHKLIYDDVLLAQGKKIGKKYGAKVEEGIIGLGKDLEVKKRYPNLKEGDIEGAGDWYLWDKNANKIVEREAETSQGMMNIKYYKSEESAELAIGVMKSKGLAPAANKVWTMRLTDKLKQASKDGMPYYVALPPLAIGAAAAEQRTDAQRLQSKSDAQAIMAN